MDIYSQYVSSDELVKGISAFIVGNANWINVTIQDPIKLVDQWLMQQGQWNLDRGLYISNYGEQFGIDEETDETVTFFFSEVLMT